MFSCFGIDSSGILIDSSLCPSLSFDKKSGLFILYYYNDNKSLYGLQSFSFDGNIFLKSWNFSKQSDSQSFDFFFFSLNYPSANSFVRNIFSFFSITPTIIFKVSHMNKKLKRKFKLSPKTAKIKSELGFINHRSPKSISLSPFDIEEINRCSHNMKLAVSLAASNFDLSFFPMWKDAYLDLLRANGNLNSSRFYEKSLFKIFKRLVDKVQKKV